MIHIKQTNLRICASRIFGATKDLMNYRVHELSFEILSILLGFFSSTALSTIPAQTGDWGIVAAGVIVTNQEIISKITYKNHGSFKCKMSSVLKGFLKYCNSIKIGIMYGLFVDAFKLGS